MAYLAALCYWIIFLALQYIKIFFVKEVKSMHIYKLRVINMLEKSGMLHNHCTLMIVTSVYMQVFLFATLAIPNGQN